MLNTPPIIRQLGDLPYRQTRGSGALAVLGRANVLNPFVDQFKTLSIGVKAYKNLVEARRDTLQAAIVNAMSEDPENIVNENEYGSFSLFYRRGDLDVMYYISYDNMVKALSGDYPNVEISYGSVGRTDTRRSIDVIKELTDRTSKLSTTLGVLAYAAYTNISNQIDWAAMSVKVKAYGGELLARDWPQITNLPGSSTVVDLIHAIFDTSGIKQETIPESDAVAFRTDEDYTTATSIEAGLQFTVQVTLDLLEGIRMEIANVVGLLDKVIKALVYVAAWIIKMVADNLLIDYTILNEYDELGVDIPLLTVSVHGGAAISSWWDWWQPWASSGNEAHNQIVGGPIYYQGTTMDGGWTIQTLIGSWINRQATQMHWRDLFLDAEGNQIPQQIYTFPTTDGFIEVIWRAKPDDRLQISYFAGAHRCRMMTPVTDIYWDPDINFLKFNIADEANPADTYALSVGEPNIDSNEKAAQYLWSCMHKEAYRESASNDVLRPLFDGLPFREIQIPTDLHNLGQENYSSADRLAEGLLSNWDFDNVHYTPASVAESNPLLRRNEAMNKLIWNTFYCLVMFIPRNRYLLKQLHVNWRVSKYVSGPGGNWDYDIAGDRPLFLDELGEVDWYPSIESIGLPYYSGRRVSTSLHVQTTTERGEEMFKFMMACLIAITVAKNGKKIKSAINKVTNKATAALLKKNALGVKIGQKLAAGEEVSDEEFAQYKRLGRKGKIVDFVTGQLKSVFGTITNAVDGLFPDDVDFGDSTDPLTDEEINALPDADDAPPVSTDVIYTLITGKPSPQYEEAPEGEPDEPNMDPE